MDKLLHILSVNVLENKWGFGLDKANLNIEYTTQVKSISYIKNLTQCYRKNLLYQNLRQLNCIFYTETLFSKEKYIIGNTCTHIYTDGDFMRINIMQYKSEPGMPLDKLNQNFGVTNKIFMDSAPKQTGYNIDTHKVANQSRIDVCTAEPYYP